MPGHEGAFRRKEKPQRAFQLILGTFADVDQLQGATAAQFLGQRTAETFQGTLGTGGERVAQGLRVTPQNHQVRAVIEVFHQRLEELAQLFELVGLHQVDWHRTPRL